jgi:hypothetical protein
MRMIGAVSISMNGEPPIVADADGVLEIPDHWEEAAIAFGLTPAPAPQVVADEPPIVDHQARKARKHV